MDAALKEYNGFVRAISDVIGRVPAYRQPYENSVLVVDFGLLSEEEHGRLAPIRETYYLWASDEESRWTSNLIADVGDDKHYVIDQVDDRVTDDGDGSSQGFNYLIAIYVK